MKNFETGSEKQDPKQQVLNEKEKEYKRLRDDVENRRQQLEANKRLLPRMNELIGAAQARMDKLVDPQSQSPALVSTFTREARSAWTDLLALKQIKRQLEDGYSLQSIGKQAVESEGIWQKDLKLLRANKDNTLNADLRLEESQKIQQMAKGLAEIVGNVK